MDKSIPSFPLPCNFKDCPTTLIKDIANYFYDLSNLLRDFNTSVHNTHQNLALASSKFARGEISQFLFSRSLTQSEYSLSDDIKNLSSLNNSLRSTANALFALLTPAEDDPFVPIPDAPADPASNH